MNLLWFGILVFSPVVYGWQHHNQQGIDRRSVVGILGGIFAPNAVQAATCVSGVGEGCQDLSEGNSYIQSLQLKSAERKAQYEKVRLKYTVPLVLKNFIGCVVATMLQYSTFTL